jgi:hypothetical protein
LNEYDVVLINVYYDGYDWQHPCCKKCGRHIKGSLPVNRHEREIYLKEREGNNEL